MDKRRLMIMNETYLTAEEIYAIDNLTEDKLLDFIALFPSEKKELVSHLFSKNRSVQVLEVLANERDEHNKQLIKMLKDNGVSHI